MSKVTGVPMVELAVRISLGATLPELGWDGGLLAAAAVRRGQGAGVLDGQAAAASTRRWGRGCSRPARSSASREDPRVALAKALLGAASLPPRPGADGRRSRCSRSPTATRGRCVELAAALVAAGYRLAATAGTRGRLPRPGYEARPVAKLGEAADPRPARSRSSTLIADGDVRLVVNTPTPRSGAVRDAAEIRLAAIAEGILCLTAMETAVAAAEALDPEIAPKLSEVRSLDEWVPAGSTERRTAVAV